MILVSIKYTDPLVNLQLKCLPLFRPSISHFLLPFNFHSLPLLPPPPLPAKRCHGGGVRTQRIKSGHFGNVMEAIWNRLESTELMVTTYLFFSRDRKTSQRSDIRCVLACTCRHRFSYLTGSFILLLFWSKTALRYDFKSCVTDSRADGWTDQPTDGRIKGRTDEWTDGRTHSPTEMQERS